MELDRLPDELETPGREIDLAEHAHKNRDEAKYPDNTDGWENAKFEQTIGGQYGVGQEVTLYIQRKVEEAGKKVRGRCCGLTLAHPRPCPDRVRDTCLTALSCRLALR